MEAGLSAEIKCQNTNPEELNQIYIINKGANRVEKMWVHNGAGRISGWI